MIAANVLTTRALAPIDMLVGTWRGFIGAHAAPLSGLESCWRAHPERDPALTRVAADRAADAARRGGHGAGARRAHPQGRQPGR